MAIKLPEPEGGNPSAPSNNWIIGAIALVAVVTLVLIFRVR